MHGGPVVNDLYPRLTNENYLTLLDPCSGYHNLKLGKKSSYLTTFTCQFGRYRYTQWPFSTAFPGDMFQHQIEDILNELTKVFHKQFLDYLEQSRTCCNKTTFHPTNSWTSSGLREN